MSNHPDRTGRILVVEDEGAVAIDVQHCLEDSGFEVTAIATSMEEAIREASTSLPDLILMDIRIKGEADGIEAAHRLRQQFGLPVIFLTAHDDADTLERAKRADPMAFLLKPFKPAELISAVEIALNRGWTEQGMRERELSFLSAMDAIGDAVLTTDREGNIRFMNRAAEQITGYRQEMALGRQASEIVHIVSEQHSSSDDFPTFLNRDGSPASDSDNEHRVVSRDGAFHWLTIRVRSIAGAGDSSIRVVVMQDATQRKQAEQALRRQADLLDQSQDPIFTWDVRGAISFWNGGARILYGYSSPEAVGRTVHDLLPAAHSATDEALQIALERDGRWSGEITRKTKDGRELTVEGLLVVVQDEAGQKTVLETDRDITGRMRTELEIRRLNEELRNRVAELTALTQELESFNYSISHDLRAPVRHIDGYTKILLEREDAGLSPEVRSYLGRVRRSAQRLGRMVDELLELSRTSRKEPAREATELKSLVDEVIFELKPELQDREIEWRLGELPVVDCDPTLTRQVFANLLGNAIKFTGPRKPAVIEIGQTPGEGETVLFVRDNGVGFDMKYAAKLFGVFQRLHRQDEFEGTGIGLATAQRIVHKHGGRIWAEAEPEKGAAFYFTLAPPGPAPRRTTQDLREAVLTGGS